MFEQMDVCSYSYAITISNSNSKFTVKMSNSNKNIKQEMSRNSRHLNAKKIHRSHLNLLIEWDITAMSA